METQTRKTYSHADIGVITVLSLYCAALVLLPVYIVRENLDAVFAKAPATEFPLFILVVSLGVLGSSLRSVAELIVDVGTRKFDRSWALGVLIRPFEGAGMALVVYITMRAGIGFLDRGASDPSPLGFLAMAALSGMFAHKAAKGLAERFERFMAKSESPRDNSNQQPGNAPKAG